MVSVTSMVCMGISGLVAVALAVGLLAWFRRQGGRMSTFFIGCAVFVVFALILERIGHQLILYGPAGGVIQGNIWLYALYGGLMAGIFEEVGRLAAFRFALRKRKEPVTALMYGAGHGGCEAVLLVGVSMVNNILVSLWYNAGTLEAHMGTVTAQGQAAVDALVQTPSWMFLLSGVERIIAVALHIALSVLVFAAVRRGRYGWFWLAVLLHAAVDAVTLLLASCLPLPVVELVLLVLVAGIVLLAHRVYTGLKKEEISPEIS